MEVRRAVIDDATGIAEARLSNGSAHDDSGASAQYCAHLIEHQHLWVAVDDGRVLGFGGGVDVGGARLLSDLFVHAEHHGRGVGTALLTEVLRGAAQSFTFATHDPAAAPMYERAGMRRRCEVLTMEVAARALSAEAGPGGLRVGTVNEAVASALETESTGVDRGPTYAYWARRSRSHTLAIDDGNDGPIAVCAVRSGGRWARIEHLAITRPDHRIDVDAGLELAVLAAVAQQLGCAELHVSVFDTRPVAALLRRSGAEVVDTALFMSTSVDVLHDRVMVIHSGFA